MIPLSWYLIFAAALFCVGLFGVLARKNAIAILMGVELMLNAVNINLVAFWRMWPGWPSWSSSLPPQRLKWRLAWPLSSRLTAVATRWSQTTSIC
jgi:multisubunit Na+/H+ antiporter MnhC subunit